MTLISPRKIEWAYENPAVGSGNPDEKRPRDLRERLSWETVKRKNFVSLVANLLTGVPVAREFASLTHCPSHASHCRCHY